MVRFLEPRWPDALESPEWSPFKAALADPARVDAYWETRPKPYALEESIGLGRIDLLLDHLERSDYTDLDNQDFWFWLRSAWLPSTASLREDPRFFATAADLGLVSLWETRGYPAGCQRLTVSTGDRLDCPGMRR